MNKIVGHQRVHLLRGGWALCLFSKKVPGEWPSGHLWTYEADATENATCIKCLERLLEECRVKRLPEKAELLKTRIARLKLSGETFTWDPPQKRLLDLLAGWSSWCARDPRGHVDHEAIIALYQKAGNLHVSDVPGGRIDVGFAVQLFLEMDLMPFITGGRLPAWPSDIPSASRATVSTPRGRSGAKVPGNTSPTASSGKPKRGSRR